jgi:hypothetical protein
MPHLCRPDIFRLRQVPHTRPIRESLIFRQYKRSETSLKQNTPIRILHPANHNIKIRYNWIRNVSALLSLTIQGWWHTEVERIRTAEQTWRCRCTSDSLLAYRLKIPRQNRSTALQQQLTGSATDTCCKQLQLTPHENLETTLNINRPFESVSGPWLTEEGRGVMHGTANWLQQKWVPALINHKMTMISAPHITPSPFSLPVRPVKLVERV